MTQEDKNLLLKDLCARLPYHVMVEYRGANVDLTQYARSIKIENCKPYLRPMSSMTPEEYEIYNGFAGYGTYEEVMVDRLNFLLSNHFDFRGLIPKGLAIKVNESNNPYKD